MMPRPLFALLCIAVVLAASCMTKFDTGACEGGLTSCSGECVDLASDEANCGECGNACGSGEVCSGSTCSAGCDPGLENCGGSCVNLATSNDHCGVCFNACAIRRHCEDSTCVCDEGLEECSGVCANLGTDPMNCGSCGVECGFGMDCVAASCTCGSGTVRCTSGECAPDDDGDGVCNTEDVCPGLDDTTPLVFRNPGFVTTGDWTLAGGAVIDPTAPGSSTAGEAVFSSSAMCTDPSVTQEVCMPGDWFTLGPLKLKFAARWEICSMSDPCNGSLRAIFDGYGRHAGDFDMVYTTNSICLGEAAYTGGTARIGLAGGLVPGTCSVPYMNSFHMDDLDIVSATTSECPEPGTILNGDFSLTWTGWAATGSGFARIEPDSGGDVSGHLIAHAATCESPRLEGSISVPLFTTVPNAAIQFQMMGTVGQELGVELYDGEMVAAQDFAARATWTSYRMCLYPLNQGNVITLFVVARFDYLCTSNIFREFWVDDFEIVSDSVTCP